jgi:hypothetical protein
MTPQQVLDALDRYEAKCTPIAGQPERFTSKGLLPRRHQAVAHVLWMCGSIRELLNEGRIEKSMRWLGFVQAVLWCFGLATIDELKDDNR